jgi:hypothetical protein
VPATIITTTSAQAIAQRRGGGCGAMTVSSTRCAKESITTSSHPAGNIFAHKLASCSQSFPIANDFHVMVK